MREEALREARTAWAKALWHRKNCSMFQNLKKCPMAALEPAGQDETREVGKSPSMLNDSHFYPKALRSPWRMFSWGRRDGK